MEWYQQRNPDRRSEIFALAAALKQAREALREARDALSYFHNSEFWNASHLAALNIVTAALSDPGMVEMPKTAERLNTL